MIIIFYLIILWVLAPFILYSLICIFEKVVDITLYIYEKLGGKYD